MTTRTSPFQKAGVEIYAALSAASLFCAWALAGATMAGFGAWALRAWGMTAVAVLFAGASLQASEVRKAARR